MNPVHHNIFPFLCIQGAPSPNVALALNTEGKLHDDVGDDLEVATIAYGDEEDPGMFFFFSGLGSVPFLITFLNTVETRYQEI